MKISALLLLLSLSIGASAQEPQIASLGDLRLQNGQTIRDCRIGYRTFGRLNAQRSNAVLFPTWFSGTTKDIAALVGPGKFIDSDQYYVIAVDALGDGVSSSPSNSVTQPRMQFPKFSIRDMVESQHELLTKHLGIRHLRVVMGISMGGMQTFQWIAAYSDFMDFAIPIVGSPRLTSYDLLLWNAEAHAIEIDPGWKNGEYAKRPAGMRVVADIHALALQTPDYWVEHTQRKNFDDALKQSEVKTETGFDCNNWLRQLQAMIGHDISETFGGNMSKAAEAVHAKLLVVPSRQDHMVNPHPALDFAKLAHAQVFELTDDCGHVAPGCNMARVGAAINKFLGRQ